MLRGLRLRRLRRRGRRVEREITLCLVEVLDGRTIAGRRDDRSLASIAFDLDCLSVSLIVLQYTNDKVEQGGGDKGLLKPLGSTLPLAIYGISPWCTS